MNRLLAKLGEHTAKRNTNRVIEDITPRFIATIIQAYHGHGLPRECITLTPDFLREHESIIPELMLEALISAVATIRIVT